MRFFEGMLSNVINIGSESVLIIMLVLVVLFSGMLGVFRLFLNDVVFRFFIYGNS